MLKEILKSTIVPQDIVYHLDDVREDSYRQVEENAGFTFPSLRFRNSVIMYTNIISFSVNIGKSFLPKLSVSFNDDTRAIVDTDFPIQDDICTVLLGNSKDTANKPIHADFKILNCNVNKDSGIVTLSGELQIPDWRTSYVRSFGNVTKFEALRLLCEELGLGMISNTNLSQDKGFRNQKGITNATYMQSLCDTIWSGDDRKFWCYIDAHYNLNVIDLITMINEPEVDETINYNIRTGDPLDVPERIVITNEGEDATAVQFGIKAWSPINLIGSTKQSSPTAIRHEIITKDYDNNAFVEKTIDNLISDNSTNKEIDVYSSFQDATTFEPVQNSLTPEFDNIDGQTLGSTLNSLGKRLILNAMNIECRLITASYLLYMTKKVPVKIFNSPSGSPQLAKDSDINNEYSISAQSERWVQVENKMFSGWYNIIGISFNYTRSNQEMFMTLLMTKRLWYEQYANQIKQ